eukprot:NODE_1976_length_1547_cov_106.221208_g1881_i0.p1 GENE.NODE_1976_length_1547_cov_106.221208_g1881_i0~~NODE_1976_length_1547_cov_106.221208_g1881_i0.p1  ORF type:complete len:374 (+),score=88.92 NODE_1976_length_1547_cov_106.221208_g1881_i0:253-1374(+)
MPQFAPEKALSLGTKGVEVLGEVLVLTRGLRLLSLRDTRLTNRALEALSKALPRMTSLVELDLSRNPLTDAALPTIVHMAETCHSLTKVILDETRITDASQLRQVAAALDANRRLQMVTAPSPRPRPLSASSSVGSAEVDKDKVKERPSSAGRPRSADRRQRLAVIASQAMAMPLPEEEEEEQDGAGEVKVKAKGPTIEAAPESTPSKASEAKSKRKAKMLPPEELPNRSNRTVYVYYCTQYRAHTKPAILSKLTDAKGEYRMGALDLSGIELGAADLPPVLQIIRLNTRMAKVGLANCSLVDKAMDQLYQALKSHKGLHTLDLSDNPALGEDGARHLLALVQANTRIKEVLLRGCQVPADLMQQIADELRSR